MPTFQIVTAGQEILKMLPMSTVADYGLLPDSAVMVVTDRQQRWIIIQPAGLNHLTAEPVKAVLDLIPDPTPLYGGTKSS